MQPFIKEAIFDAILGEIDIDNYSIEQLATRVGLYRNLTIVLVPQPMLGFAEFGYWLKGPTRDYIFYESNTAKVHQDHIIMHELGHMLLGHETYRVTANSTAADALCLMRTMARSNREEEEAEGFAIALQHEIVRRMGLRSLTSDRVTTKGWAALFNSSLSDGNRAK